MLLSMYTLLEYMGRFVTNVYHGQIIMFNRTLSFTVDDSILPWFMLSRLILLQVSVNRFKGNVITFIV